jgi:hypothetical protein
VKPLKRTMFMGIATRAFLACACLLLFTVARAVAPIDLDSFRGSSSCTEAGLLATLALLHGDRAQAFLDEQGVRYWPLQ